MSFTQPANLIESIRAIGKLESIQDIQDKLSHTIKWNVSYERLYLITLDEKLAPSDILTLFEVKKNIPKSQLPKIPFLELAIKELIDDKEIFKVYNSEKGNKQYSFFSLSTTDNIFGMLVFGNEKKVLTKYQIKICQLIAEQLTFTMDKIHKRQKLEDANKELNSLNQLLKENEQRLKISEKELRRALKQVALASKAKSEFLANMSHDLRTPMNAIIGFLGLLKNTDLDKKQKDYVNITGESSAILLTLINNVLDISKIEAGKLELENINFDLKALIEAQTKLMQFVLKEKDTKCLFSIDKNLPRYFKGDPMRISQILCNLLSNAVKFTENGQINVTARLDAVADMRLAPNSSLRSSVGQATDEAQTLRISVKDTGIGIPRDKQATIFDSFTQVYQSTTRQYGGTGLGLSIVKRLVEKMGGKIWIVSTENQGSEFIFTLKLGKGKAPSKAIPVAAKEAALKGVKVLVVEDNVVNLKLSKIILEKMGCKVSTALSGEEAIEKMKGTVWDVILMDIQMPGMDGFKTAKMIRKEVSKHTPIIGLSAAVAKKDKEKALASGMNDYITKPIDVNKLKKAILKWGKREAQ